MSSLLVESAYLLDRDLLSLMDRSGKELDRESFAARARQIEADFDFIVIHRCLHRG